MKIKSHAHYQNCKRKKKNFFFLHPKKKKKKEKCWKCLKEGRSNQERKKITLNSKTMLPFVMSS